MAATKEKVEVKVIIPEAKTEAANKETSAATATPSMLQEENPEPALKCKIWNLKVSVHCEGCKRKAKKILHDIEGVYKVDVDLRQQKATVMGNVDGQTLVKTLIKKTGKHAELLAEKADQKDHKKKRKKSKNKHKDKLSEDHENSEEGGDNISEKDKDLLLKNGVFTVQDPSKNNAQVGFTGRTGNDCVGNVVKVGEVSCKTGGGVVQIKDVGRNEVKPVVILPPGSQSPRFAAAGSGSPSNHGQRFFSSPYPTSHSPPRQQMQQFSPNYYPRSPYPTVQSPPRHHAYEQPIYYHAPAVAVSHSTVHPSATYGGSYHAPRYEYAYMHPGSEIEPPPSDSHSCSSDSFEFLSDENPNACSIM